MKKLRVILVLMAILLPGISRAVGSEREIVLVYDGEPAATIILAEEPTRVAQLAAKELQFHVQKITGASLPIVADNVPVEGNRILVGESAATIALGLRSRDFKRQEYMIKFLPATVVLIGRDKDDRGSLDYASGDGFPCHFDEQGTLYATYDFLERFLDIRWYLPTDIGITFTERKTLVVGGEDVRRSPHMKFRHTSPRPYPLDLAGDTVEGPEPARPLPRRDHMLWLFRNRKGGERFPVGHAFYGYYDRFLEDHPEWFAQGFEDHPKPPQLCFTHPGLIKQVIQDARHYFDREGAGNYFRVGAMDVDVWCQCPDCQAIILEEATKGQGHFSNNRVSDYFFGFVNKVAREIKKSHPDKYIASLAYWSYAFPPSFELEPNIALEVCLQVRCWHDPDVRKNDLAILEAWAERGNPIFLRLYYCFPAFIATLGNYRTFPPFFGHEIVRQFEIFREANVRGLYIEPSYLAHMHQSALLDQVEFHVTWRLADNPDLDGNALIYEFFERFYGAAAEPMRRFYEKVEQIYWDPENRPAGMRAGFRLFRTGVAELSWKYLATEERMAQLGRYMEQAQALAETDLEKQRVALFERGIWQYMVKGREEFWRYARIPLQSVTVPRIVAPVEVSPQELDWSRAGVLTNWRALSGAATDKRVEGRLLHDGTNLYLRLEDMMDPGQLADRGVSFWRFTKSDVYTISIGRQRNKPYHQITIHFQGPYLARRHGEGPPWDPGVTIISDLDAPDRWTLYVTLPLEKILQGGVKPGEKFYMNIFRSMGWGDAIAWNPTVGSPFAPERFGEVLLLDAK